MFTKLNLPFFSFRTKQVDQKSYIFDTIRKKFVKLTPEEWVRQNLVRYLIEGLAYPASLIAIEAPLSINTLKMRSDVVVYKRNGQPLLAIECKAPEVKITQKVFDQIARYNMQLKVQYLLVSNGLTHFCCMINPEDHTYRFLPEIPSYNVLQKD